jgi:hypothetical protein
MPSTLGDCGAARTGQRVLEGTAALGGESSLCADALVVTFAQMPWGVTHQRDSLLMCATENGFNRCDCSLCVVQIPSA